MTLNSKMGRWPRVVSSLSDNFQGTIDFFFSCSLKANEVILAALAVTCTKQSETNQNLLMHFDVF